MQNRFFRRRSFDARPVFSADEAGGTRFKMERFLHPGRAAVATVYGPIAFGPLPLLAFQRCAGGGLRLAAAGAPLLQASVFGLAWRSGGHKQWRRHRM